MTKKSKPISAYRLCALLVLLLLLAPMLPGDDWSCEDALYVCAAMNWSPVDPTGLIRCMLGYSFCLEYIDQHLKK